jgi:hypothetical protein
MEMEPVEFELSENVKALLGYPDAHVEIKVKVPVIGSVKLKIKAEELDQVENVIEKAIKIRERLEKMSEK